MPKDTRWIYAAHLGSWTLFDDSQRTLHILNYVPADFRTVDPLCFSLRSYGVDPQGTRQRLPNNYALISIPLEIPTALRQKENELKFLDFVYTKYEDAIFAGAEDQIFSPMMLLAKGLEL